MARGKNSRRRVSVTSQSSHVPPSKPSAPHFATCKTCVKNGSLHCSGQCLLNLASFGHTSARDVQDAIEYHWKILPTSIRQFLLKDPSSLCLRKFVAFYSNPENEENTSRNVAASICGCSWYLSLHYMFLGQLAEAKGLILNAAFLQEVYNNKPVAEIAALCISTNGEEITLSNLEFKQSLPFFHDGLFACSSIENMSAFLRTKLTPTFVAQTSQAKRQAQNYVDYISSSWGDGGGIGGNSPDKDPACDTEKIEVVLVDSDSDERRTLKIGTTSTLKALFNKYADERGVSLRSLRFSYDDKTLFLSLVGQKTPNDLGMKNLDVIVVAKNEQEAAATTGNSTKSKANRRGSNSPGNGGMARRNSLEIKNRRAQRRASWTGCVDTQSEEYRKMKHSRQLTLLFEEAGPIFSKIRQELNVLCIERSKPKRKTLNGRPPMMIEPINNPGTDGLGGKAGKVFFNVNVGQVDNLYKTSKPAFSSNRSNNFTIDLHGHTEEEALQRLDESLPEWMDAAMQGEYPFVVPVLIVCGGGAQILSEVVERWIKENDCVANAPKKTISRRISL
ncbi:hypothetical protein HJC23_006415 [Cyclotella cryptica]|uniref:Smr domain-containing protein n=1 Tax=Cyclotella cryptica TaxID=29204 RepID=A0ABD3QUD4_9STRA|eukprot:CCRYP_001824-RA/>CCRYP_001824-RA protein AED:0.03 eAED:0.03 QI:282/1/1/1/1/1/2/142/560